MRSHSPPCYIGSPPPHLPADLQNAYNSALFLLETVEAVCDFFGYTARLTATDTLAAQHNAKMWKRSAVRHLLEMEREVIRCEAAILLVSNEITASNRTPIYLPSFDCGRCLEPNAHQASLGLARAMLELAIDVGDDKALVRHCRGENVDLRLKPKAIARNWLCVAEDIAVMPWADWSKLQETLLVEAAATAHRRLQTDAQPRWPTNGYINGTEKHTPEMPAPDGPVPPHWLRWHGELLQVGSRRSRLSWKLLHHFWRRNSAAYEDLQGPDLPWPDPVTDSAVATAVNRFNNDVPNDFPWKLATKERSVVKESRRNPIV